ncbi:MAG: hypothetical protein KBS91_01320, partial [Firmicutes bacterium]|nr:hypothetical protein [Candidatus Caballimonas caccae]
IKKPKRHIFVLIFNVLLILFQLVSAFTKSIALKEIYESDLLGSIFSIDVILMVVLYYLYANMRKLKKGGSKDE